ncbi:thiamine biosynthesis protein ThiJ [Corynebacterium sp. HMSC065D07]|uniref:DJ-1/PfpI family protein n=1 Tax=Corynebacterium TaxID=1716 RepID=UPI0008A30D08|nr:MULTISPECIES: DJ-1/PfpI family protein [Corynebacterium]OFL61966.1 thiamine biosynthesis protein ThiJ [Corynebacterium sp. HMSC065D07]TRX31168.1 DJ-1/PfpI family protein [Corynebacterium guaraldiae]TRX36613.1 DJ-1/PfpI family protein [Corynebacterium guaraldiae]
MDTEPLRIAVVLFEGFELLDVFGPVQLFQAVPDVTVVFAGPTGEPVASSQGVEVVPTMPYGQIEPADVLLVPGGKGTRKLVEDESFLSWLRGVGAQAPLVASVCTGSAVLAAAGLLEGYTATSNKRAYSWATSFGGDVSWRPEARWVHDRNRWTSSGVAAGMDMTVSLIAHLVSDSAAIDAANFAEYDAHRDSEWDPFARLNGLVS